MRMSLRSSNSILKKYIVGYAVMATLMCVFLLIGIITSMYMTRQYTLLTKQLSDINQLEKTIDTLCMDIEKAAVYFQMEGIDDYPNAKKKVLESIELMSENSNEKYSRSTRDLLATLDSLLNESDGLIEDIQKYIVHDDSIVQSTFLNSKYQRVSELRTFVSNCIQDVYAYNLEEMTLKQAQLEKIQAYLYVMWAIMLLITIVGAFWYVERVYKDMYHSITELERGIREFQKDVYNMNPIIISSGDEFEQLAETFNYMTHLISEQMSMISESALIKERLAAAENENLKMYSELQKSHLIFLQSRINPHFLFNTLNMIASMAMLEGAEKSSEMLTTTAAFLRYNLDNVSKQVTLGQEIHNLEDYLTIQEYRYGERFTFECLMGHGTEDLLMPAMILQPMVENSILHGVGMMQSGGKVWISTSRMGDKVVLCVRDNGVGMTDAQIDALYESIHKVDAMNTNIGLRNIYQRLQLFYDNKVEISLHNLEQGLEINIFVPYRGKEENG